MLWRGLNVTAKPFNPNDSIGNSGIAAWKFDGKNFLEDKDVRRNFSKFEMKQALHKAFEEWGEKARVMIRVKWIDGNYHGFTARFSNGKIIYEDPQSASILDIDEVLKKVTLVKGLNFFVRIDNREFTEAVADAVEYLE